MGPLFVPVPAAMSKLNEGAEVAYYMCGKIFQEPQILMNAAHMWNTDSLGACAIPADAGQCRDLYNRYAKRQADPPGVFGEGGFLELACRSLYGEQGGQAHGKALRHEAVSDLLRARTLSSGISDRDCTTTGRPT